MLKINWSPERIYGLDILRAVAIMMVLVGHGRFLLPKEMQALHKYFIFDGVSMFFVLSGFLIGGILIKIIEDQRPQKSKMLNFWVRKWFRTLPNYFLILIVLVLLHEYQFKTFSTSQVSSYFIFSQNLFQKHPNFFGEAWSLSIEEWFYLIVPIVIFVLMKVLSPKRSVLIVCIMIIVLTISFRWYRFSVEELVKYSDWDLLFRKQVSTRLDSLMFGVFGGYLQYYYPKIWNKNKLLYLFFGILIFILAKSFKNMGMVNYLGLYNCVFSFSLIALATLMLLPFLSTFKKGEGKLYKAVTYISLTSYSIYLVNYTLIQKLVVKKIDFSHFIENSYLLMGIKYFLFYFLTITLSILLYKYWEMPMMKLRDSNFVKRLLGR